MKQLNQLNKRDFHLLVLNAVLRQPSIEKIAEVLERDELELLDLVKDIQKAIVETFKLGMSEDRLYTAIKREHINRIKRDEEREEALKKLRFKEWQQKRKLP